MFGEPISPYKTLPVLLPFAIFFFLQVGWADGPATTAGDETPQEFLARTASDRVAAMTLDQAMALVDFNPESDADRASAKLWADSLVAAGKLIVATREKWGKDAETAACHALSEDTPDDDAKAQWAINGDHAIATYQINTLTPEMLVRRNGHWKLDMDGYRRAVGDKLKLDEMVRANTAMIERLTQDLSKKDAFANADDFVRHVKDEVNKVSGTEK